jgi:hypothetical protein
MAISGTTPVSATNLLLPSTNLEWRSSFDLKHPHIEQKNLHLADNVME